MKITRNTKCKRRMKFYSNNFGFREPYNILIDGTFCNEALQHKVQIEEQLKTYFGAELNIFTTQCCIAEIETLTTINYGLSGAWLILKRFRAVRCGHEGRPVLAAACLEAVVRRGRYILATMNTKLRDTINRDVAGVPVMYLYGPAPTLLKPGEASVRESQRGGREMVVKNNERLAEIKAALSIEDDDDDEEEESKKMKKKRKRNKNVNASHESSSDLPSRKKKRKLKRDTENESTNVSLEDNVMECTDVDSVDDQTKKLSKKKKSKKPKHNPEKFVNIDKPKKTKKKTVEA